MPVPFFTYAYCKNDPVNATDPGGTSGLGALAAWPMDMKWAGQATGAMDYSDNFGYMAVVSSHSGASGNGPGIGVMRLNYITLKGKEGYNSAWPVKAGNRMIELAKHSAIFAKEFEYMMNSKAEFRFQEDGVGGIVLDPRSSEKGLTTHQWVIQNAYEKEHGGSHVMVPVTLPSDIDSSSFPAEITLPHEVQHAADRVTGYSERDPMGIGIYNSGDDLAPSGTIWSSAGLEQRGYRAGNLVGAEIFGQRFNPSKDAHVWDGVRGYTIPLPEYKNR